MAEAKSVDKIRTAIKFFWQYASHDYSFEVRMTAVLIVTTLEWVLDEGVGAVSMTRLMTGLREQKTNCGELDVSAV